MGQSLRLNNTYLDISFVIISFSMTFIRIILVLYASLLIMTSISETKYQICFLILLVMLFDYYDGLFFKKSQMNEIKTLRIKRRLFDSFADRFIIHIGSLSLLIMDINFLPVYAAILIRELLISGYCVVRYKQQFLIYPKKIAKLGSFFVGLTVIAHLILGLSLIILTTSIMLTISLFALLEYHNSYLNFLKPSNLNYEKSNIFEIF